MDTLLNWELDLIIQLRAILPGLTEVFEVLTSLGGELFFLVLLPLIYWSLDRRTGARLTVLFLISALTNSTAKLLFQSPRPFEVAVDQTAPLFNVPLEEAIETYEAHGNGFPSGHTQNTVVVWGYMAGQVRLLKEQLAPLRTLAYVAIALLVILVPLSRVYLAVHFPRDLLGGYVLGIILLVLFVNVTPRAEAYLARIDSKGQIAIAVALPLAVLFIVPDKNAITAAATLLGMGVGFVMERRWIGFTSEGPILHRALRLLLGLAVLGGLYAGLKTAFDGLEPTQIYRFLRYTLIGLWGSLGAPWAFTRLGLTKH